MCRRLVRGVFTSKNNGVRYEWVRDEVGLELLSAGEVGMAFVGEDKLREWRLSGRVSAYRTLDASPIDCRLALAARTSRLGAIKRALRDGTRLTVATTYPKLLEEFAKKKNYNLDVTWIPKGGCESFVAVGRTDLVFDIVQSGATLAENKLTIIDKEPSLSLYALDAVTVYPDITTALGCVSRVYVDRLEQARQGKADDSYTVQLLGDRNRLIKKIGEEAAEFLQEVILADPKRADAMVGEAADLLYVIGLSLTLSGRSLLDAINQDVARNRGQQ